MTTKVKTARPGTVERAAWFAAGLFLAGSLSALLRSACHRLRESHDAQGMLAWLGVSASIAFSGLTWQSAMGAIGTLTGLIMACVSASREARAWRELKGRRSEH